MNLFYLIMYAPNDGQEIFA